MQHTRNETTRNAVQGRDPTGAQPGLVAALDAQLDLPSRLATEATELHTLRAELECVRAERDHLREQQRTIAELLKCANPDKVVHDVRGLLHEAQLLRTLIDVQDNNGKGF